MGSGMKKMLLGVAVAGVLAMGSFANAATVLSLITPGPLPAGGPNYIQDFDQEYVLSKNTAGVYTHEQFIANGSVIQVGDVIRGGIDFHIIQPASGGPANLGGSTGNEQLTAVFDIKVTSKVASATPGLFNFTFGVDSGFTEALGLGITQNETTNRGATIVAYTNPTATTHLTKISGDLAPPTIAAGMASVITPNVFLALGFTGVAGETYILNNAPGAVTPAAGFPATGLSVTSYFDQNKIAGIGAASGLNFVPIFDPATLNSAQFTGFSTLVLANSNTSNFDVASQSTVNFAVAVPLPASVWTGLVMLSMGVGATLLRRRQSVAL